MTPCNNVITPTMIRKGQVQIGDKIEFEDMAVSPAVSEAVTDPQERIPSANMQSTTTNNMANDSGVWFRPQAGSTSPSYINPNASVEHCFRSVDLPEHDRLCQFFGKQRSADPDLRRAKQSVDAAGVRTDD